MQVQISEARLNDFVYLTLKKFFFEPAGLGNPRECDIRVCMTMVAPQTWQGNPIAAAILLPDEVSPRGHEPNLGVDTDRVFEECITYLEDHWMKQSFADASGNPAAKQEMKEFYDKMVPAILEMPEDQCGPR